MVQIRQLANASAEIPDSGRVTSNSQVVYTAPAAHSHGERVYEVAKATGFPISQRNSTTPNNSTWYLFSPLPPLSCCFNIMQRVWSTYLVGPSHSLDLDDSNSMVGNLKYLINSVSYLNFNSTSIDYLKITDMPVDNING